MTLVLSEQQGQAVDALSDPCEWRRPHEFAVLAGFAGSGKTSIAPTIIDVMNAKRPLFLAPTNKAAKVLTSKGLPATSIHKAIYHPPGENDPPELKDMNAQIAEAEKTGDDELTAELILRRDTLLDSLRLADPELIWRINPEGDAAHADLILVDEASMVGKQLGTDLASFGVPIIAIGDPGQLPPVNDEMFFPLNRPDFLLTEIHRQAADNPIIQLSQDIRQGKRLRPCTMGDQVVIAHRGEIDIPDTVDTMPQIICGTHRRRWKITEGVRMMLGYRGMLPNPGEKILVRKNSKTHGMLINGAEGFCEHISKDHHEKHVLNARVTIDGEHVKCRAWDGPFREHEFAEKVRPRRMSPDWASSMENEQFDFGWAITCHASQGSQWDHVLVYDEGEVFRNDAARWRYTAATRAAERLTVII